MYGRNLGSLAAVCLMALFLGTANAAEEVRIVNGDSIHVSQTPYIVQLRKWNQPFCGGTLVHPQFVVTAAHCFDSISPQDIEIVGGANTRTDDGVKRRVIGIVKPSLYTKDTMNADVAILKLESPMQGPYIKPVGLCSRPVPANQLIQVSGWGHTSSGGVGSHDLRTIRIGVMDLKDCQAKYRFNVPITSYMSCAYPTNQDSCQGDSGGPAVYNEELCGVVSFGAGCASGSPGMYTDVYALRTFIGDAIKSMM